MHFIELALLFFLMIITGGWMATMVVFARGYRRMSAAAYVEAEQTNSKLACMYFAPSIVVTALLGVAYLFQIGDMASSAYMLTAIGVVVLVVTALFVKFKVLPINDTIAAWSRTNPPENWQAVRARWIWYHTVRTVLGLVAFFLIASAIIWS